MKKAIELFAIVVGTAYILLVSYNFVMYIKQSGYAF